jgi:hypothetical protein
MPESTLDHLRKIGEAVRSAEAEGVDRSELMALWQQRKEAVKDALADERRPVDIARALGVSRERVYQLAD